MIFTALCFKTKNHVFSKNDFPFLDKKLDIYFCPFFLSDAISFLGKMTILVYYHNVNFYVIMYFYQRLYALLYCESLYCLILSGLLLHLREHLSSF